jgi:hypothetical protein
MEAVALASMKLTSLGLVEVSTRASKTYVPFLPRPYSRIGSLTIY